VPLRFDFLVEKLKRRKSAKSVAGTGKIQGDQSQVASAFAKPGHGGPNQAVAKRRRTA